MQPDDSVELRSTQLERRQDLGFKAHQHRHQIVASLAKPAIAVWTQIKPPQKPAVL